MNKRTMKKLLLILFVFLVTQSGIYSAWAQPTKVRKPAGAKPGGPAKAPKAGEASKAGNEDIEVLGEFEDAEEGEGSDRISGGIDIEEEEGEKDPYQVAQDEALSYFEKLEKYTAELGAGNYSAPPELSEKSLTKLLTHLNGVYLFCSAQKGIYPLVLDAILESDIINAKAQGKLTCEPNQKSCNCPHMRKFWELWIQNDMQKKQRFLTKIGHYKDITSFQQNRLPRYVRCSQTVSSELDGSPEAKEFFAKRYSSGSLQRDTIIRLISELRNLKDKRLQVFTASTPNSVVSGVCNK